MKDLGVEEEEEPLGIENPEVEAGSEAEMEDFFFTEGEVETAWSSETWDGRTNGE